MLLLFNKYLLFYVQVNVVHIDAVGKNAADDKLRQNIRRFSDTHAPPARIVLISSKTQTINSRNVLK